MQYWENEKEEEEEERNKKERKKKAELPSLIWTSTGY